MAMDFNLCSLVSNQLEKHMLISTYRLCFDDATDPMGKRNRPYLQLDEVHCQ